MGAGGAEGDSVSREPSISADGRYVAFESEATNLVSGGTNGNGDIFVHDRQTGVTTWVSVGVAGAQGDAPSYASSISADGRYVAFASDATNLVSGDTNGRSDVFVHDRQTATTVRVSVAPDGTNGGNMSMEPSISADGRYVAFTSFANNLVSGDNNSTSDIFVRDRQTSTTTRVSLGAGGTQGNGWSEQSSISGDGRHVVFVSSATNLVSGDTNANHDIFVHDRQSSTTTRVSVGTGGGEGNSESSQPSISADGRYVAFGSTASNLVPGDTNGYRDIFVHDRQTGSTTCVSVASDGSQGDSDSFETSISTDGRNIAFLSYATNLISGDTNGQGDVFVVRNLFAP